MYKFPIGVIIESFSVDTKTAIEKSAKLGADGIQMYATKGENAPENLCRDRKYVYRFSCSKSICSYVSCSIAFCMEKRSFQGKEQMENISCREYHGDIPASFQYTFLYIFSGSPYPP